MKALAKKEMAAVDNAMVRMGIDVPMMMELAGLFVAISAAGMANGCKGKRILVLGGRGNNGGDALAAARHLLNWGHKVDVILAVPVSRLKPMPLRQWKILVKMGIAQKRMGRKISGGCCLIVDGLLGYNSEGNPRGSYASLIEAANRSGIPILSVDVPSGLDATTGKPYSPCIKASKTIALSAPKKGLVAKSAKMHVGKVLVAYMGVPKSISRRFGLGGFSGNSLISPLP